jgi:hypothetical protein
MMARIAVVAFAMLLGAGIARAQNGAAQKQSTANNTSQSQTSFPQPDFHGTYEGLNPTQKKLIDEWYADYNKLTGDHADPKEYNQYSLSTRTTYEAVTHALQNTVLTDQAGKPMGTAMDLVEAIEAINGKVTRARGDLQFRMYVVLKPDARQKLKDSSEFFRDRDNTVYHRGYPLNYRQDGTPSIQFSMTKDGRHADIDVDYRSSGFPTGLFNGHLTAANSDVRAGNNTQVHLQRWQGLTDWWASLFGLPGVVDDDSADLLPGDVPPVPRKGEGKLEDAVQDFLQAWLVEQKPEISASYFSPRSFTCLAEFAPQSGRVMNAGNAPYVAARDLAKISKAIGPVTAPAQVVRPESLQGRDIKAMKQPYMTTFALYQVSNGVAADFECDPDQAYDEQEKSRASRTEGKQGNYFASVFRLKGAKSTSDAITLLWAKESKVWKIVAWQVEPDKSKPGATPDTRRGVGITAAGPEKAKATAKVKADPAVLQATHDFLHTWLVNDDYDRASAYVSQSCNACVGLYLAEGEKPPSTPDEYAAYIRSTLNRVAQKVGKAEHLREALEPIRATHEDLKTVEHVGEHAYTLVAVPDELEASFLCHKRSTKEPYAPDESGTMHYGKYYATLFTFRTPGEHSAAMTLLWGKENGQWKIISYEVVTP